MLTIVGMLVVVLVIVLPVLNQGRRGLTHCPWRTRRRRRRRNRFILILCIEEGIALRNCNCWLRRQGCVGCHSADGLIGTKLYITIMIAFSRILINDGRNGYGSRSSGDRSEILLMMLMIRTPFWSSDRRARGRFVFGYMCRSHGGNGELNGYASVEREK